MLVLEHLVAQLQRREEWLRRTDGVRMVRELLVSKRVEYDQDQFADTGSFDFAGSAAHIAV